MNESKRTPLYMFHGWGFDCSVFDKLSAELAEDFDVRAVSLLGYGEQKSEKTDKSKYSLLIQSRKIGNTIKKDSILLGWSMGGLFATRIASIFPDKIKSLILMASTPCFVRKKNWPNAMSGKVFDSFMNGYHKEPKATLEKFSYLTTQGDEQRHWLRELTKQNTVQIAPEALEAGLEILQKSDLRVELSKIKIKTTMIFGGEDSLIPVEVTDQIKMQNPQIQTHVIPGASHTLFLSHLEQVATIVRSHAKTG